MFAQSTYYLDNYEVIKFHHKKAKTGFEIIPAFGARLNSLRLSNGTVSDLEVIDGFNTAEELIHDQAYKSALLFPFPNRLKDGCFSLNGQAYHFPINEEERNNAIHGFIANQPFEVTNVKTSKENVEVTLGYQQAPNLEFYPFSFDFFITYKLDRFSNFEVVIEIKNTGTESLPFGLGWHPYFTLPDWHDVQLKITDVHQVELDDRALPSGSMNNYTALSEFATMGQLQLDDCFKLRNGDRDIAFLQNGKAGLKIWRDVDSIPYLQIYTPEKNCVAIEPMTCNVDALNNKMGMISLKKDELYTTSFGVSMTG